MLPIRTKKQSAKQTRQLSANTGFLTLRVPRLRELTSTSTSIGTISRLESQTSHIEQSVFSETATISQTSDQELKAIPSISDQYNHRVIAANDQAVARELFESLPSSMHSQNAEEIIQELQPQMPDHGVRRYQHKYAARLDTDLENHSQQLELDRPLIQTGHSNPARVNISTNIHSSDGGFSDTMTFLPAASDARYRPVQWPATQTSMSEEQHFARYSSHQQVRLSNQGRLNLGSDNFLTFSFAPELFLPRASPPPTSQQHSVVPVSQRNHLEKPRTALSSGSVHIPGHHGQNSDQKSLDSIFLPHMQEPEQIDEPFRNAPA